MTEMELIESLKSFLETTLQDINQESPSTDIEPHVGSLRTVKLLKTKEITNTDVKVNIYNGFVPTKAQNKSVFPYISIFLTGGDVDIERCNCKVQFDIGVYDENDNRSLFNIIRRILNALSSLDNWTLDKKFVLNFPFSWTVLDENKHPYHQASILTSWSWYAPRPQNFSLI